MDQEPGTRVQFDVFEQEPMALLPMPIAMIATTVKAAGGSYCFGVSRPSGALVNVVIRDVPKSMADAVLEAGFQQLFMESTRYFVWWLSQAR